MGTNGHPTWMDSDAGKQLEQTLTQEKTLKALDHILERIETIESAVEKLSNVMRQGPGMVSMAADMADEAVSNASKKGIDIDQRLQSALQIAEKLTAPEMIEKLEGLFSFAHQAPGLMSITTDIADETFRNAYESGVDIDRRLKDALAIAEKLTSPEMMGKLDKLFDFVHQAPGLISIGVDIVDEQVKYAADMGVDVDKRIQSAIQMAEKFTSPDMIEQMNSMFKMMDQLPGMMAMTMDVFDAEINKAVSKGFDIDAIKQVSGDLIMAMSKASEMPPAKVGGPIGFLRAMKDKDRQKALSYFLDFAKAFGQYMQYRDVGYKPIK